MSDTEAGDLETSHVRDLVTANRILAHHRVFDAWGHISIRSPHDPARFFMSTSRAPALVVEQDVVELNVDTGEVVGERTSYAERHIHAGIYRRRANIQAVVHTHSSGLIPFGAVGRPLRAIAHTDAFLIDGCPMFEIRDETDDHTMLVESSQLGDALARRLGDAAIVLMRGHGATVVAPSLREVVYRAIYASHAADLELTVWGLGDAPRYLGEQEARAAASAIAATAQRPWELWSAQVGRPANGKDRHDR
ncbi:class II aldolase/adducin family protein [Microbacterium sp. 1P10UB]|uniref:class II aldolase/adducin family protein n=1 Tax=unclassified Microbacterium TaxID=2609290 RepID=UPI0039A347EC